MKFSNAWTQRRSQDLLHHLLSRVSRRGLIFHPRPVPLSSNRFQDQIIVRDFRARMKLAEELIGKLSFSLHEIQSQRDPNDVTADARRYAERRSGNQVRAKVADIFSAIKKNRRSTEPS